jgi:hypothetical protein
MHPDDGNPEDLPGQDTHPSPPAETDLERRPDNVGQSGRWRHKETGKTSPRYGHEEATHSTDQGWPAQVVTQGRKAIRLKRLPGVRKGGGLLYLPTSMEISLSANGEKNGH